MNEMKFETQFNISQFMFRTMSVLLVLVLCSFWMICDIFARYASNDAASDFSKVASFNVTAVADETETNLTLDDAIVAKEYNIYLKNNSEVDATFKVTLVFEESLPNGINIKIDGRDYSLVSGDNKVFVYDNMGELAGMQDRTLIMLLSIDRDVFTEEYNDVEIEEILRFTTKVYFEQVD